MFVSIKIINFMKYFSEKNMKLKNLILLSALVMLFTMFLGTKSTYAQTNVWYVDNLSGNDSYDGKSPVFVAPNSGPRKTIAAGVLPGPVGALQSAVAGDVIYVAYTGSPYNTTDGEPNPISITKKVTVRSYTSGTYATPTGNAITLVPGLTINNANAAGSANYNQVIFDNGSFNVSGDFTLTAGVLVGGDKLTVADGRTVTRTNGSILTGQLLFGGNNIDFVYNGANATTGLEFKPASGTFRNLTTNGANPVLTVDRSVTMTGLITLNNDLRLGSYTLTVSGANLGHSTNSNIVGGTLLFSMSGNTTLTLSAGVNRYVNNITATRTAGTPVLTLANVTDVQGNLLAQSSASITGPAVDSVYGTVTATSSANITLAAVTVLGGTTNFAGDELINSGTGVITVSAIKVNGNVNLNTTSITPSAANAGLAKILFTAAAGITVAGNVTNQASFALGNNDNALNTDGAAGYANFNGVILFPDVNVAITGNVLAQNTFTSTTYTAARSSKWNGIIAFTNSNTALTITGSLTNNSSSNLSFATYTASSFQDNGIIVFPFLSTGVVRVDGGIVNSSNFSQAISGGNYTDNGVIDLDYFDAGGTYVAAPPAAGAFGAVTHKGAGTIGVNSVPGRIGQLTNSSAGRVAGDGNGDIYLGPDGIFYGTNVTVSGSAAGGYTIFPNANFNINGSILNSRTSGGNCLQIGTAATAGATVVVSGNIRNTGTSTTTFKTSSTGAVSVAGLVESTNNGIITFPEITTAASTIGQFNISNGTIHIDGNGGASTISVNGAFTMTGGVVDFSAAAAAGVVSVNGTSTTANLYGGELKMANRANITLNCLNIGIGNSTMKPTFTTVTQLTIGTPTPVNTNTVTIGTLQPQLAGIFQINSGAGIVTSCRITGGGLFKVDVFDLHMGYTNIDSARIYLPTAGAAFINDAGYYSTRQGCVVLAGPANQTITTTLPNGGAFGDIEITNTTALPVDGVSFGANLGAFKGTIYLTQGQANNTANNISFDNNSVYPTIVVNQGKLTAQPLFVSKVNVLYTGIDKVTGNEIPNVGTYPDKLNDLFVATTNGTEGNGQGAVLITQNAIVNGKLTVNAGQNLVIGDGFTLSLAGPTADVQGNIVNVTNGTLNLVAPWPGTAVTAAGYLPTTVVANGSNGNSITGVKAFIDGLLGADALVGNHGGVFSAPYNVGAADPALTAANGELFYAGANGSLTLAVGASPFTAAGQHASHIDGITTAGATDTLKLAANLVDEGIGTGLSHAGGVIDLGTYTLSEYDASPAITGGAQIIGTGKIAFVNTVNNTTLSLVNSDVTIAANIQVAIGNANKFLINNATAGNLIAAGAFTLTSGKIQLGNGAARNLTLTGSSLAVGSGAGFDPIATSFGTLILNPTVAPLTWTEANATPEYAQVEIKNDVVTDQAAALTDLNIKNALTLTSGELNFGADNVKMLSGSLLTRGLHGTGAFNTATATGYLIVDGATITTGDNAALLSVNNLRFLANASTITGTAANNSFTVNKVLDLQNTAANTSNTTNGKFAVASNVRVNWSSGTFSVAPAYAQPITLNLVSYLAGGTALDANVWPTAMPNLVSTLIVNGTAAADQVDLPAGSLKVNSALSLYLTRGIVNVPVGTTLELASGINIYRTNLSQITVAGTLTFPSDDNVNLTYLANTNNIASGAELPLTLNKLVVTRNVDNNNFVTTLGHSVTVKDSLVIKNDITQVAPSVLAANGAIVVTRDVNSLSTTPQVNIASFKVGGADGQTMVLGGNIQFPNFTIQMQGTNPILKVNGSFTIPGGGGLLTFYNGIIEMLDGILYLPRPAVAANSGLGYSRDLLTGVGHVVGNVARPGNANDGQTTDGRFVFPTGTKPDLAGKVYFRPITLTFNGSYPLGSPTTIVVNHKSVSPEGTKGFENGLDGGAGVTIGKYPNFYWGVTATPTGLSQNQMYDVEMQGSNLGYPYETYINLRGIRRLANSVQNPWLMLTTDGENNAQQIFGTDTTVWVRSTATQGGMVSTESRFTIGIPVIAPGFSVPVTNPAAVAGKEGLALSLPYTVATNLLGGAAPVVNYTIDPAPSSSVVIPAITKNTVGGQVSGNVTWTPGFAAAGSYTVTITAQDNGGVATAVYNLTVADSNRAPVAVLTTPGTPKVGAPLTITLNGTDADGDPITWNKSYPAVAPHGTVTPAAAVVGNQYVITFTPDFTDLGKVITIRVSYTDGKIGAPVTLDVPLAKVVMPQEYGDVDRNGTIQAFDAIEALRMSVGLTTGNPNGNMPGIPYDQYNYALADVDTIHNVGVIAAYPQYGVSAWDAYLILWKSLNPSVNHLPIEGVAKAVAASGELAIGKAVAKDNGLVAVPLTVANAKNVFTVTFELKMDTKVAEVVGLTNTPKDWLTAYSVENGVVKVVMAGITAASSSNLGEITLKLKNKEDKVEISGVATINNLESRTLATMTVGQVPTKFGLDQNYPNPFNPSTTIKYQIAEPTKVNIKIYSIDGQLVKTLVSDTKDAGYYQVVWNGTNSFGKQVASGMYIYRIDAGNFVSTKKLMLMK
jgi:hypothetical protein